MSYQERKTLTTILTGAMVLVAYCIYAFSKAAADSAVAGDLKFWAGTMLVFIGIGIVATIIIQIIFHILYSITVAIRQKIQNEACDDQEIEKSVELEFVEDERDRLIELKSMRIGFIIAGVGFVAGLAALVLNYSAGVMLNIVYISFNIGSLFEGVGQLYYYRRGV